MKIEIKEQDYNGKPFTAELRDYTNKWYANFDFTITGGGDTPEIAAENLKEKAKEMIEEINKVIYQPPNNLYQ